MKKTLKTAATSATLAVMFLSAGAFANANHSVSLAPAKVNITVISKSSAWPIKGQVTFQPCTVVRCLEA